MRHFKATGLVTVVIGVFAILLVFGGICGAKTTFKLAHMFSPGSLPGKSADKFAEFVAEESGQKIEVTVLPGGALGDERANLQQLKSGSIDMALTGDLVMSYMAKPYMLASMPFIYDSPDHTLAVFKGAIGSEIADYLLKNHGIQVLDWHYVGTRVVTANNPVKNLQELKKLKMRLPPAEIWVKTWEKTGAQIASIAFTELYLALQTGTVDGQENPPNFIRAQKFYEVQKYVMETNHVHQMQVYFMNAQRMGKMSDADRKAIQAAAKKATDWTIQKAKEGQDSDLEWLLTEGGMKLVKPDFSMIQDLIKSVPSEVGGEKGVALYNRIRALAR